MLVHKDFSYIDLYRMKKNDEAVIRDYLVNNISFIETGLEFIDKEYKLDNPLGTRGFIDILAKDTNSNIVIIEIKRSDNTARQALHELCKYAALVKQALHLRNSEIRLIIVSTEWDELIVPFSEFYQETSYNLEGCRIEVDNNNLPLRKEQVIPVSTAAPRSISPRHTAFLYTTESDRDKGIEILKEQLSARQIEDFILIKLFGNKPKIIYPYAIYLVFQRQSKSFYLEILKAFPEYFNEVLEADFDQDSPGFLSELEEYFMATISIHPDTLEIGYPEKFKSVIDDQGWEISELLKFGIFQKDFRLTSEILINEIKGYTGTSNFWYYKATNSKLRAQIKEIESSFAQCLPFNQIWKNDLLSILNYVKSKQDEFNLTLSIFNPEDILQSLFMTVTDSPTLYLPAYYVIIDYTAKELPLEVFEGVLKWTEKKPNLMEIIISHFESDPYMYFLYKGCHLIYEKNIDIMRELGLYYSSAYLTVLGDQHKQIESFEIKNNKVLELKRPHSKHVYNFITASEEFMSQLIDLFQSNSITVSNY